MSRMPAAVRRAALQLVDAAIGDHAAVGSPVELVGSNSFASPRRERAASVSCTRSALIDVASTGPSHSRIVGTTRLVVLPDCVGATTSTEVRGSLATSWRW